jgi:hypothetical protein
MNKTFSYLFTIIFSSYLFSCNSNTVDQKQTGNSKAVPTAKNDTVSGVKTDSPAVNKTETAENATVKVHPDSADFYKVLTFKIISFTVKAIGKGSLQQVTIQPAGLTITNRAETLETEPVVNAEIADLNADGFPELLIFTQSAGSGSYGKVVAFSVNNGKSMSQVSFPETSQNSELKKGYGGHDKFSIVNNTLTQEFPIYKEGDANSKPTGKKRVITYKLKNGEASRVFVVDQVNEVERK